MELIGGILILIIIGLFFAYIYFLWGLMVLSWPALICSLGLSLFGCLVVCFFKWSENKKNIYQSLHVHVEAHNSKHFLVPDSSWKEILPFYFYPWFLFFVSGGILLFFTFAPPADLHWHHPSHYLMNANVQLLVPYALFSWLLNQFIGLPLGRWVFKENLFKPFNELSTEVLLLKDAIQHAYSESKNAVTYERLLPLPKVENMYNSFYEHITFMTPERTPKAFTDFNINIDLFRTEIIPKTKVAWDLIAAISLLSCSQLAPFRQSINAELKAIIHMDIKVHIIKTSYWNIDVHGYLAKLNQLKSDLEHLQSLLLFYLSDLSKIEIIERRIIEVSGKLSLFASEEIQRHFSKSLEGLNTARFQISLFFKSQPENHFDIIYKQIKDLESCADLALKTNQRIAIAAKYSVKALTSSMVCMIDEILDGFASDEMGRLLSDGEFDCYREILNDMNTTLENIIHQVKPQQKTKTKATQKTSRDAYVILGLKKNASQQQIKKQYRHLSKSYHPDLASTTTPEIQKLAEERFKEINWAYKKLQIG